MKRFSIFVLMAFAVATFYISCGESNEPEKKLKNLKKAVERTTDTAEDKLKDAKKEVDKAAKQVEKAVEKTEEAVEKALD